MRSRAIKLPKKKECNHEEYFAGLICVLLLVLIRARSQQQDNTPVEPMDQTPVFRVNVVSRTTKAVNYRHRGGSTTVDIKGTEPDAGSDRQGQGGQQERDACRSMSIFPRWARPSRVGPQFLTYVLWAITPEGRAKNLGEIVPDDTERAAWM